MEGIYDKMEAYQHFSDHRPWRQPHNQTHGHPSKYRHESLMNGTYSLYLQIVRGPERQNQQHANEE
jgi:hypothetical protein